MLEQLKMLDAISGAPLVAIVLAAGLLLWRWLVLQDRRVDDARAQRFEAQRAEIAALGGAVAEVGRQVGACATEAELRRVEGEVRALQSDVRTELAKMGGALDVLATRLTGQGEVLHRIDDYLRRAER